MDQATHNKIASFIWGITDDVLRDLFKRGKYPDVILPMFVIRRMDAVLEPTKQTVLDTKKMLDDARITEQRAACGIEAFIRREVLPYTPDAWIKEDATKIGYEISFTRHFYTPQPLRTLEDIRADILAVGKEAKGLLDGLRKVAAYP